MAHLIFSRRPDNAFLTTDEVAVKAPAVFAHTKAARLTSRYVSLASSSLIPVMQDYGYHITQAAQKKGRLTQEHSSHLLAFSKPQDVADSTGVRPEIILYNSHDGTSSVKLFAGAFRFICSNGIVAGQGYSSKLYHTKSALSGFEDMLKNIVDSMPSLMDKMERLRHMQLSFEEREAMATAAVKTRWSMLDNTVSDAPVKGSYATRATVVDALQHHRQQDAAVDAFTLWNRIQENVLRGNLMIKSFNKLGEGTYRKSRPVASVSEHVRINSELFNLLPA